MTIQNAQVGVPVLFTTTANCQNSCDSACADFTIKRHDTYPPFRVSAEDCAGALDLSDPNLVLEASMWTSAKLKADLTNNPTDPDYQVFQLAGNRGFDQIMVGDIIVMAQARLPEQMLIIGFDEADKYIYVQRGYHGTPVAAWKKGSSMKIFRILNAQSPQTSIEHVTGKELGIDGSYHGDAVQGTFLTYNWASGDTCLAGCYMLEFKLIKMTPMTIVTPTWPDSQGINFPQWDGNWPQWDGMAWNWPQWDGNGWAYPSIPSVSIPSVSIPSVPSLNPTTGDYGCDVGTGVEWVRRFPVDRDGFTIQIMESPTSENVY